MAFTALIVRTTTSIARAISNGPSVLSILIPPALAVNPYSNTMRKIFWLAQDKDNKCLGIFRSKKVAYNFCNEEEITLTKLVWNGFYHSEKPLDYDPYTEGKVKLYDAMF